MMEFEKWPTHYSENIDILSTEIVIRLECKMMLTRVVVRRAVNRNSHFLAWRVERACKQGHKAEL